MVGIKSLQCVQVERRPHDYLLLILQWQILDVYSGRDQDHRFLKTKLTELMEGQTRQRLPMVTGNMCRAE